MKLLVYLLLGIVSFDNALVPLDSTQLSGLTVVKQKEWPGSSLYGFMNGGSELYLEYGFKTMTHQQLTFQDQPFEIEYYTMADPTCAYGIYSVNCYQCSRSDSIAPNECLVPLYLQFCHGSLYVAITATKRGENVSQKMDLLAQTIMANNPASESALVPQDAKQPVSGKDYYVQGDLGLAAAHITWSRCFEAFPHYKMWLNGGTTQPFSAIVEFDSEADLQTFLSQEVLSKEDAPIVVSPLGPKSCSVTDK